MAAASTPPRFSSLVLSKPQPETAAAFEIRGVDLAVVNSVRRCIMTEVPTAAFRFDAGGGQGQGIRILSNTSSLHNEFVGHRISLVPLGFSENQLETFDPTHYSFVLKVKNTGMTGVRTVTTADVEVFDQTGARVKPEVSTALFPPSAVTGDHILLLRLKPSALGDGNGEEVSVECTATLGVGRDHARWSPVSSCFFRNKVDPGKAAAGLRQHLDDAIARRAAAGQPELSEAETARMSAQFATLDAHRCFYKDEHGDPDVFEFVIESTTRLQPTYLFYKALRVLVGKLEAVAAALESPGGLEGLGGHLVGKIEVGSYPNLDDFYHVTIRGEDHTLGNLLQGMLYRRWVREGRSAEVSYVGYYQPHPLENHIIVKIKCAVPGDDVRARLADGIRWMVSSLSDLTLEFVRFSGLDRASPPVAGVPEFVERFAKRTAADTVASKVAAAKQQKKQGADAPAATPRPRARAKA
jgi:DNA-directed RNA polymerase subunit L/DNA-directed RNA polymerase alpha subunit